MSFFSPNTKFYSNYYDKARFLLAWRVSLSFTIIFTVLSVLFSFNNVKALTMSLSTLTVMASGLIYLAKTKKYKPLFLVYAISGTILSHIAMNYVLEYPHYVDFLWMVATILIAFVGLGKKQGLLFLGMNTVGIGLFFWFSLNKHIEILQPRASVELVGDFIEILLAMFVIGYLLHLYMAFNDYSEKKLKEANTELATQNRLITATNEENITLVKEIHHRVKNNLQIITSLLRLQKGDLPPEYEQKFDEAINRIMTMSLIHKRLYQEEELSNIDIKTYILDLSKEIKHVFESSTSVEINVSTTIKSLGLKTVVPFGLLINELISNSFKHAFNSSKKGVISIDLKLIKDNKIELKYADNGTWKEPTENCSCFGLELIEMLIEQLEGSVNRTESSYSFVFKNLDV